MKKAIAYYRVSRARQERSGLGLEAQQAAVTHFAKANCFKLVAEFREQRSGMRAGNPALSAALVACRRQNATLLIATLDRLKRNVLFVATLMEADVPFEIVANPQADEFTIHVLAAVAQKEGRDISKRTTAALAAAKRRGTELGKYGRYVLSKRNKRLANAFMHKMRPIIKELRQRGITTVRALTDRLNKLHIPTYYPEGHRWHVATVHRLLKRMDSHSS